MPCRFKLHFSYSVVQIKFSAFYEKNFIIKEIAHNDRYIFHTIISLWRWVIPFEYI